MNDTINKFISSNSLSSTTELYQKLSELLSSAGTASASSYRQTELK